MVSALSVFVNEVYSGRTELNTTYEISSCFTKSHVKDKFERLLCACSRCDQVHSLYCRWPATNAPFNTKIAAWPPTQRSMKLN